MNYTSSPARPTPTPVTAPDSLADVGTSGRSLRMLVGRRPLITFFVLSCLLSWWPTLLSGPTGGGLAGFGPFLAALIVLAYARGRSGVVDLLARMIRWRVAPSAYLAAVGIPLLVTAAAISFNLAIGATSPAADSLAAWTQIPLTVVLMLLIPGMGGAWEEPGFRGFALGRLERRFGVSAAPLLLGVFWVFWHLPLFLDGAIRWSDIVVIVAASVVLAAVYHRGQDSILIAMLMHATNNAVGGEFARQLFTGSDATRLSLCIGAGWTLTAIVTVVLRRARTDHPATAASASQVSGPRARP